MSTARELREAAAQAHADALWALRSAQAHYNATLARLHDAIEECEALEAEAQEGAR